MDRLTLPKTDEGGVPYLSYSQISTWKRSKRDYMRQYFFGEKFEGNAYTDFGSKVGEAIENNDFSGFTAKEAKFLQSVPRYDEFEREIKLQMGSFYIKGFIDTNDLKGKSVSKIADYKTGDIEKKTAEYESDDYTQLHIYAGAMRQELGVLPKDVKVYLIGRTGNAFKGEELKLDCRYHTITKEVTDETVNKVLADIREIAEDIAAHYKIFKTINV